MNKAVSQKLSSASTYDEWKDAAIAHDKRNGFDRWKNTEKSSLYDYASIRRRMEQLEVYREANDNHSLLFTLNEGIHGNLGGMGRASLYQKAKFGTKKLINDYVDEVTSALEHLAKPRVKGVTQQEKIDFFQRASLCFGRSALLMSGSGTYLFFHIGVLKALWEQNLLPDVISGSSGGSIVASILGSRPPEKVGEIFEPDFLKLGSDFKTVLNSFLSLGSKNDEVSSSSGLQAIIEELVPDVTFEEAYNISGIQINISITPAEAYQKSRLLNAITTPNVMLREAVLASCCLPGVFEPVMLAAKNVDGERVPYLPNRRWVDGSLSDDLPMKRLSRLYGVNHFIVSQTNPIVLPFVRAEKNNSGVLSTISETGLKTIKDWGLAAGHLLQKPLRKNSYISKLLKGYISVVSQSYTGDINIMPSSRFLNPAKLLASRSDEEISDLIQDGEKASWPQIERIRLQTQISRLLWRIDQELNVHILKGNPKRRAG